MIEFQTAFDSATRTDSKAVFLYFSYSILADQLLQLVGGLLFHVFIGVTVDIQGDASIDFHRINDTTSRPGHGWDISGHFRT